MKKIDRLGWAAAIAIKTYGVRIGIRTNDPIALRWVKSHLPQGFEVRTTPVVDRLYSIIVGGKGLRRNVRRLSLLYGDHVRLARSVEVEEILRTLESDLRLYVAAVARNRVFVHAGVVGWKGQAIVIPGRSFSGKSTLIAELVRAGATYYSDEYAVFDSRGRVHPFPKPLEIRDNGDARQTKLPVSELGGRTGTRPLPVNLVLISKFKAGARWRPRQLTRGEAVLALLAHTVSARRAPERALVTLPQVVARATILKGVRGEAREAARVILERFGH